MPVYTYTTIDDPLDAGTTFPLGALAINNNGQIVGSYTDSKGTVHGFLFSNGSYTTLDDPSGTTVPSGINNLGQIVGDYGDGQGGSLAPGDRGWTQAARESQSPGASTAPRGVGATSAIDRIAAKIVLTRRIVWFERNDGEPECPRKTTPR